MSFTITVPGWWPWALTCAGCFLLGCTLTYLWIRAATMRGIGRAFGWY